MCLLTSQGRLICTVLVAVAFLAPLSAKILVFYSDNPSVSTDDLRRGASLIHGAENGEGFSAGLQAQGIAYKLSDGLLLSADLSPGSASTTFIWSDGPVKMGSGFRTPGGTVFENISTSLARKAPGNKEPGAAVASSLITAFKGAKLNGKELVVSYSLAAAGKVSVEAFGLKGQSLGRWKWEESALGNHEKVLDLKTAISGGGPVFVNWSLKGQQTTKRAIEFRTK